MNEFASSRLSLVPTLCPLVVSPQRTPADFFYPHQGLAKTAGLWHCQQMAHESYTHRYLREVLNRTKTIVAVGISLNDVRPSFFVGRYLSLRGYRILPVNPAYAGQEAFGATVYASMADIPKSEDPIHMVDIFRRSEEAGAVVDEALDLFLDRGLQTIWMQITVINPEAAERARAKGVEVIMDMCPKMEHQRLWGELSKGGINSGVISSKLW